MSIYHDEVEIEDMEYDEEFEMYYYPCPCGDKFEISKVGQCNSIYIFWLKFTGDCRLNNSRGSVLWCLE